VSSPGTISARMALRTVRLGESYGIDVRTLYDAAGLSRRALEAEDARVPYAASDAMVEELAARVGAAGLGLRFALATGDDPYGVLGLVLMASPTLREGLVRVERYQRLWGDGDRFAVVVNGGSGIVRFAAHGPPRLAHAVLAECALAEVVRGARRLTGREVRPRAVRFAHASLDRGEALNRFFGRAPVFRAERSEVEIDADVLDQPLRDSNATYLRLFERDAARQLSRLPAIASLAGQLRELLRLELAGGAPSLALLARRFHMSPRTLQRRLGSEGTTFQAVLDVARRETALALVERGASRAEIAWLVGFSDTSALHRALRRWRRAAS
jgi:AraC-like DNA-binding protein